MKQTAVNVIAIAIIMLTVGISAFMLNLQGVKLEPGHFIEAGGGGGILACLWLLIAEIVRRVSLKSR
jgi:hypothetical protein